LVHSCGSERRVSAELYADSEGQAGSEVNVRIKLKVRLSIPASYAMDVYVAPQDNTMPVAGIIITCTV